MSVYFITCRKLNVVKIGVACDPAQRLKSLQTGFPMRLKVEAAMPGSFKEERRLHKLLAKHRTQGEWFNLCPEIEAIIKEIRSPKRVKSMAQMRNMNGLRDETPEKPVRREFVQRIVGFPDPLPPPRVTPAFDERRLTREQRKRIASGDIHFPFRERALEGTP